MTARSMEHSSGARPCSALVPDVGCRRQMLWRTSLDSSFGAPLFCRAVVEAGLRDVGPARPTLVATFEEVHTGHRLVFVPRTGRIQLRLGALTPHAQRRDAAHRFYGWICDTLVEVAS